MNEVNDKLTIRILIGRQEHEINVRRQDEEVFRKAAKIITEQLGRYEQKFRGQSYETYLSITLLDFVVHSIRHQKDIDLLINKYLNNWTLDRLSLVDQAILEVATYEIIYTDIDIKIAINEAVELAKKYSDDKVKSMINACLDKIAKEKING